jgi:hypothetical protein
MLFKGPKTQCFVHLGTPLKFNQHWSAIDERSKNVTLSARAEHFGSMRYHRPPLRDFELESPGYKQLVKDIAFALKNTGGLVSLVVIPEDNDEDASYRPVKGDCRALDEKWRIALFNPETGETTLVPSHASG